MSILLPTLGKLYSYLAPCWVGCVSLSGSVKEVTADKVVITRKDPKDKDAKPITEEISAGFVLWSTGIGTSKRRSLIGPPEMS